jgi:hypothetical protein
MKILPHPALSKGEGFESTVCLKSSPLERMKEGFAV